jgi:hypothetical protein
MAQSLVIHALLAKSQLNAILAKAKRLVGASQSRKEILHLYQITAFACVENAYQSFQLHNYWLFH